MPRGVSGGPQQSARSTTAAPAGAPDAVRRKPVSSECGTGALKKVSKVPHCPRPPLQRQEAERGWEVGSALGWMLPDAGGRRRPRSPA